MECYLLFSLEIILLIRKNEVEKEDDNNIEFVPDPDYIIKEEDMLIIAGKDKDIKHMLQNIRSTR